MTDAIASVLAQSAAAEAAASPSRGTVTQEQFLRLFLAQLQHQDPLSPLEPEQMTAQLAQFASLEQLSGVNARLDTLSVLSQQGVLALIGKEVTFEGGRLTIEGGTVPSVRYTLDDRAARVTATVRGADGEVVRVVDLGAQEAGPHTFEFDGRSADGSQLADGIYRVEIGAAAGADEPAIPISLLVQDVVDGVDFSVEPPVLLVGGLRIPLNQVREVGLRAPSSDGGS